MTTYLLTLIDEYGEERDVEMVADSVSFDGGGVQFWRAKVGNQTITTTLIAAHSPRRWSHVAPKVPELVGEPVPTQCARCGRTPAEGFATIGLERFCHGDVSEPTCYQVAMAALGGRPSARTYREAIAPR